MIKANGICPLRFEVCTIQNRYTQNGNKVSSGMYIVNDRRQFGLMILFALIYIQDSCGYITYCSKSTGFALLLVFKVKYYHVNKKGVSLLYTYSIMPPVSFKMLIHGYNRTEFIQRGFSI